jgi:hypothetical protein
MTPESRNCSFLGHGSVNIPAAANTRNNIRAVFSVAHAKSATTQRCSKHISAAVNQLATIEEALFYLGTAPRLYKEDLRQLERELRESQELVLGKKIEKN